MVEGNAKETDAAVKSLQYYKEYFSNRWGLGYLSHCNTKYSHLQLPRESINGGQNTEHGKGDDSARIFALSPKTNRKTIALWMKSIRPAIDEILTERLGERYNASLVRQGRTDIQAKLCILIESPNIPGPDAQESIKDQLRDVCRENRHAPIQVRFLKGTFQKLYGGQDDNSKVTASEEPHLKFNFNRPCSRPGMGASLGLLCSTKVSATLGGYIEILGKIYILTSDHFIAKAQEDEAAEDDEQIILPSLLDLREMSESLQQTLRDFHAKSELLFRRSERWDRPIKPCELNSIVGVDGVVSGLVGIEQRLEQLNRPPAEFALGKVFRRTTEEPRVALSSNSGISLSHQMDWCVCEANDRAGRNQHKYRSNCDAMADNYIYEKDRIQNPGELCYETCDIDPGVEVYYVGQKSGYRSGTVSPTVVSTSIGSKKSSEWAIIGEHGIIPLENVEGDSGAWVIRRYDNKLMGQIIAHATGQILFTPITVIFEDIKDKLRLTSDISLPRPLGNHPSGPTDTLTHANQLCAIQDKPKGHIYHWLEPEALKHTDLDHYLTTDDNACFPTNHPLMQHLKENSEGSDDGSCTELADSEQAPLSPVPSLTTSLSIPEAEMDTPKKLLFSDPVEPLEDQYDHASLLQEPVVEIVDDSVSFNQQNVSDDSTSEEPDSASLKAEAPSVHLSFRFTFYSTAILRSLTWPPTVNRRTAQIKHGRQDSMPINFHRHVLNTWICGE